MLAVAQERIDALGLRNVELLEMDTEALEVAQEGFASPDEYVDFMRDIAPPIRALVSERTPEEQDTFWNAIRQGARGLPVPMEASTYPATLY